MTNAHAMENLSDKHHTLEAEIQEEMARPMTDSLRVSELKREKLRVKELISDIQEEEREAS